MELVDLHFSHKTFPNILCEVDDERETVIKTYGTLRKAMATRAFSVAEAILFGLPSLRSNASCIHSSPAYMTTKTVMEIRPIVYKLRTCPTSLSIKKYH